MTRLVAVELRRLWHRRLTRVTLALLLLGHLVVGLALYQDSKPPTEQQRQDMAQAYQRAVEQWKVDGPGIIEQCERENEVLGMQGSEPMRCTDLGPQQQSYRFAPRTVSGPVLGMHYFTTITLLAASMLVAASFVAAEFTTRAMGTWLVVEPRRTSVVASKLLAVGLGALLVSLVFCALDLAGFGLVARLARMTNDLTGAQEAHLAAQMLRVLAIVPLAAMAAAGLAFLTRHTVAVVATIAGYALVSTFYLTNGSFAGLHRIGLVQHLSAWFDGTHTYWLMDCTVNRDSCRQIAYTLTRSDSILWLGGLSVVTMVLGWLAFRRRDVV
ncbi:hypothetical protein ACTQ49_01860 [Luteococcus sp. Sow4_B9]|uniref:hypothetical protein n=1 Tax=Luteococcus sp. Sow4_B9 TaxID=3438792 RepID=UPI003F950DC0